MGYPCLLVLKMELSVKKSGWCCLWFANTSQDVGACDLWPLARSTIHPFSALLQLWVSNKSRKKNTTNLNSKHFLVDPETQQKICFPNKSITIPVLIILWNLVGHWNCTRELKKNNVLICYLLKTQNFRGKYLLN